MARLSATFEKYVDDLVSSHEVVPHPRDISHIECGFFERLDVKRLNLSLPSETAIQNGLLKVKTAFFYSNTTLLYTLPLLEENVELYFIHTSPDINNWEHIQRQSVREECEKYFKVLQDTYHFRTKHNSTRELYSG